MPCDVQSPNQTQNSRVRAVKNRRAVCDERLPLARNCAISLRHVVVGFSVPLDFTTKSKPRWFFSDASETDSNCGVPNRQYHPRYIAEGSFGLCCKVKLRVQPSTERMP